MVREIFEFNMCLIFVIEDCIGATDLSSCFYYRFHFLRSRVLWRFCVNCFSSLSKLSTIKTYFCERFSIWESLSLPILFASKTYLAKGLNTSYVQPY